MNRSSLQNCWTLSISSGPSFSKKHHLGCQDLSPSPELLVTPQIGSPEGPVPLQQAFIARPLLPVSGFGIWDQPCSRRLRRVGMGSFAVFCLAEVRVGWLWGQGQGKQWKGHKQEGRDNLTEPSSSSVKGQHWRQSCFLFYKSACLLCSPLPSVSPRCRVMTFWLFIHYSLSSGKGFHRVTLFLVL